MACDVAIRRLDRSDIHPLMLGSFEHKQTITDKWVKDGDQYKLMKTCEIRGWDAEKRMWIPRYLLEQMERGGSVLGAFLDGRLVGFSSLDGILQGGPEKYADLTMLFVDDRWKRRGIGKRLFQQICLCAQAMDADRIFISAIPSYDTISFYFRMGCSDARYIISAFIDTEHDRYLEYSLKGHTEEPGRAAGGPAF